MGPWAFSKFVFQSCPPDMAEARTRWTFGVYEILDKREGPFEPAVLHVVYRGVVELPPEQVPNPSDDAYSAKLEEAIVKRYRANSGY